MGNIVPIYIPQENVNDETVKIIQWLVGDGEAVRTGQLLVEVETSKSTFEIQSPATGVIQRVIAEKLEVPVGDVLCYIGESLAEIEAFRTSQPPHPAASPSPAALPKVETRREAEQHATDISFSAVPPPYHGSRISRAAQELIRSKQLNESDFSGRGLIRQSDVLVHLGQAIPAPAIEAGAAKSEPAPRGAAGVPVRNEPLTRSKRFEARLLSWSRRHAIRSAVTVAVPTRGLAEPNRRDPAAAEFLSAAVIFESARLLRKYPHLNAYATDDQACFYDQVNIGYALDAGRGLKVPVLREADCKTIHDLIVQRRQFLADYLNDAVRPETMAGSTFTVTDLSGDGVFTFDPLIVEAQSAILGIGAEFELPGLAASAYNLVLAFDHRLVEGRMAARFLGELKTRLQAHEEATSGYVTADPAPQPHCSQCLMPLGEIQRMKGFLVQTVGNSRRENKLICSICLRGH